jgi:hypothetical protein
MKSPLGPVLASILVTLSGAAGVRGQTTPTPRPQNANTPGMSLAYHEKSRGVENDLELVNYSLEASGFPEDKRYALYGRWMDGRSAELARGITIGESRGLVTSKGDEFVLTLGRMFQGEFATFALVSEDGAAKAFVEITPFPIQAEGKGGCRLFVRPMDPKGQVFSITGSGFKPDKTLKTVSSSSNEVAYGSLKGRPDGTVKMVVFPAVVGRTGGDASFEASDSDCSVKIGYKWGDQLRGPSSPSARPTP